MIILDDEHSIEVSEITIHPFANPQNHSFPVRLELPVLQRRLYPGMLVKVAITIGSIRRLVVPRQALVSRAEVNAVYVLDEGGNISFRQVRPGNRYDEQIEILAGLGEGEIIALDPVNAGIHYKHQQDAAE